MPSEKKFPSPRWGLGLSWAIDRGLAPTATVLCPFRAGADRMVSLVESVLDLHKQLPAARAEHDKTLIQRQISATDKQIDKLVYELYGLTEEEIVIIEDNAV